MKTSIFALLTVVITSQGFAAPVGTADPVPAEPDPVETPEVPRETAPSTAHVEFPGTLNIQLLDKPRLEKEYLSLLRDRDQRSYEFLYSAIETLHSGFLELQDSLQTLQQLADESLTGPISVQDYLTAVRSYNQQVSFLDDRIIGLDLFPTMKEDAAADMSSTIQMQPLKEHYQSKLRTLDTQVNRLYFRLGLASGAMFEQVGIDTQRLQGVQLFSAEQIKRMKRDLLKKRAMPTRAQVTIDQSINAYTREALQGFVKTFGTTERYRASSDSLGRYNAVQDLQDAFWARFYIRATYGIKIGSIAVDYQKQIFNADYLLSDVQIGAVSVWNESHLMMALNLATEAQATLFNKGAWWITKSLRALSTMVTGVTATEEAKKVIIGLIRLDLEQELALGKSGGLKKVRANYRDFYYTSEEQKARVKAREQVVFGDADDDDLEADVGVVDAGTLKGVISQCINVLEQMEVNLEEASKLQASLDVITKDNAVIAKRKKRASL